MFCFSFSIFGQKITEKKANILFKKKSYIEAAELYKQLPSNQNILQNLADCYYYNSLMNDAINSYGKLYSLYNKDSIAPGYSFRYSQALLGVAKYHKADSIMSIYLQTEVSTPKFLNSLASTVPYNYKIKLMSINTSNGDFGLSFRGETAVFASSKITESKLFNWNNKPYLDLFSAYIDDQEIINNIIPFSDEINTKTHESSATFTSDGKTMYFNRTNHKKIKIGDRKIANIKIFKAQYVDNIWTNIVELPFCSDSYSTEHPFISKDGKKLYFSSDMPGSLGSFDIFVVDVNEDGTYGQPQNLGDVINTINREQFPFIANGNNGEELYFASNGHQGIGGLDIFVSKFYDGIYVKPLNLGKTINSNLDDFAYILKGNNKGYISSNRDGGDNLYSFYRTENENRYIVGGTVKDKNNNKLLAGALVKLFDENEILIGQMVVGEDAAYLFGTEPNKKYRIEATNDLYIPLIQEFTNSEEDKLHYTLDLLMECYDDAEEVISKHQEGKVQIVLENIYFDLDKSNIKPDAARILDGLVTLLKKYPAMEIEIDAHTDNRASNAYNLALSKRRAASTLEYLTVKGIKRKRLTSNGFGESVPLIKCDSPKVCSEQEHSTNRRCEFIIMK